MLLSLAPHPFLAAAPLALPLLLVPAAQAQTIPAAPTGLKAAAGPGARQVTLTWTKPNSNFVTKYQYNVRGSGGWYGWQDIPGSDADTVRFTVTHFKPGGNRLSANFYYHFQVRAVAGTVNGLASSTVIATAPAAPTLLAPTGLKAAAGPGRRQVTLTWNNPSNSTISKYQYRRRVFSSWGSWVDILNSGAKTVRHTQTGLGSGSTYHFQIRAVAGTVNGPASSTVTATAPASRPHPPGPHGLQGHSGTGAQAGDPDLEQPQQQRHQQVSIPPAGLQ